MKRLLSLGILLLGISALGTPIAKAQTLTGFTTGDIVVERVGDGSAALTSAGTAVFLDEYTPTGAFVGTFGLPNAAGTPLVESGTATSDGEITLSTNGQYILVPGYSAALGTTGVTGALSTAVPREVATVSGSLGVVQTTINSFSANNIRSAASVDGTTIFASGGNTGILTVLSGSTNTTGTVVSNTSANNRQVSIYNGQLYLSSGSGAFRIATVGTGVSTTAGQTATEVPGIASGASPNVGGAYGFVATTLTLASSATDTIYVADNTNGFIDKFSLVGGTYVLTGQVALAGVTGLTGLTLGTTETLYASTATNLYSLIDATGAGGTLVAAPTSIAAVGANEAFRGIAFAPSVSVIPEPSTYGLLLVGGLGIWAAARVHARKRTA